MITIKDIKEQYIDPALGKLPYNFKLFTETGAFERAIKSKNMRRSIINGVMRVTESDLALLGGGLQACAVNVSLRFLVPVPDGDVDEEGNYAGDYSFVDTFRDNLTSVLAKTEKITLTDEDGNTHVGAVSGEFPIGVEILQRQIIGASFEYTCFLEFAYLKNAVNSSDVSFFLDGEDTPLPITSFAINRSSTLTANLLSSSTKGQSSVFSENSVFSIDVTLPAIRPDFYPSSAYQIYDYLMGRSNMNDGHTLVVEYANKQIELNVIIAKVVDNGEGGSNVSRQVSFVPMIEAEDDDDTSGEYID